MNDQNQIISHYRESGSIKETSRWAEISEQSVRRILLAAGEYSSPRSLAISKMDADGMSVAQIADVLGLKPNTVCAYMPYKRGSYATGEKTANARRIAAMRTRRRSEKNEA